MLHALLNASLIHELLKQLMYATFHEACYASCIQHLNAHASWAAQSKASFIGSNFIGP
jgi:hypothetical protein